MTKNEYKLFFNELKEIEKNHKILINLNRKGITQVKKELLAEEHFNFNYFTNVYQTKKGVTYFYCYDVGYMKMENERCRLVEKFDSIV